MEHKYFIEARGLTKFFPVTAGIIREKKVADIRAVDNVGFYIKQGETLGLVGESGCGKTTVGRCVLQLIQVTRGEVYFDGLNLCTMQAEDLRRTRRRMQLIFQDPYGSLNPRMTAADNVGEPLKVHQMASGAAYKEKVLELMNTVGLNPHMAERYPHEFSGGQRQRLGIARALSLNPDFMVCDEPVSALDVSIQAQIINLLSELQTRFRLTFLFIAHDLAVVRHMSDRVAVMYLGKIAEIAASADIYKTPLHPYTRALLSVVPIPDPALESMREHIILQGDVPSPLAPLPGCNFHTRCNLAIARCWEEIPLLRDMGEEHWVACHLV
jgi:oligopeptide transport system ATP-binding protein